MRYWHAPHTDARDARPCCVPHSRRLMLDRHPCPSPVLVVWFTNDADVVDHQHPRLCPAPTCHSAPISPLCAGAGPRGAPTIWVSVADTMRLPPALLCEPGVEQPVPPADAHCRPPNSSPCPACSWVMASVAFTAGVTQWLVRTASNWACPLCVHVSSLCAAQQPVLLFRRPSA